MSFDITTLNLNPIDISSEKEKEDKALEKIEFNEKQREVLTRYSQDNFDTWLQKFWAKRAQEAKFVINEQTLLTKLTDMSDKIRKQAKEWVQKKKKGDQICLDLKKIEVFDTFCSHCLCGHEIRYAYYIDGYGPIGSTCIHILAGIDKKIVGKFTRTYRKINGIRKEIKKILVEKTFDEWAKEFDLDNKLANIEKLDEEHQEIINDFVNAKLPLPMKYTNALVKFDTEAEKKAS